MKDPTLDYYNQNAKDFYENTINADMSTQLKHFTDLLPERSLILDFGCGSGRDSRVLLDEGYLVEAVDGSLELCKLAEENTGIPVQYMFFEDLDVVERYDGIWACASLLHVPFKKLKEILSKIQSALKKDGIAYLSFKYGDFEGLRGGRYFTDMNEQRFKTLLESVKGLTLEECYQTYDVRKERENEKWLNLILKRKN